MADGPCYNERAFHHVRGQATRGLQSQLSFRNEYTFASTAEEEPVIPDPSLFTVHTRTKDSRSPDSSPTWKPPSVAECAIHLEFLTVLHVLKGNVLSSKGIDRAMGYTSDTRPLQSTLEKWQEGKWTKFKEFAVVRFLAWANALNGRIMKEESEGADVNSTSDVVLSEAPLDVLMVWAALMLNPRMYRQHFSGRPIYRLTFPWDAIHASINNQTWLFEHRRTEQTATTMEQIRLSQDLFHQLKKWPFPKEQQVGHKYIGLKAFKFGDSNVGTTNGANPKHDKNLKRHARLFGDVDKRFAKQLMEAVARQEVFIEKMVDLMWLRSPAIEGTLRRATERYGQFMELMKRKPVTMLVPTQDITLVWHTHQCAGGQYAKDMEAHVGRFINHNDSVILKEDGPGYATTRKLFCEQFNQEYRVCGCWDCEMLIDEVEKVVHLDADEVDMKEISQRAERTLLFYRAVEITRRKGERLPIWEQSK